MFFIAQSVFYTQSAVRSLQSIFYTDRLFSIYKRFPEISVAK